MSSENAIGLNSVVFFNFRNEFSLDELKKGIGAATGGELQLPGRILCSGLNWRQVASTIGVSDAHNDQIREPSVLSKEFNSARRVAHVCIAVSHVQHGIT